LVSLNLVIVKYDDGLTAVLLELTCLEPAAFQRYPFALPIQAPGPLLRRGSQTQLLPELSSHASQAISTD
jgi:hypothetical protein